MRTGGFKNMNADQIIQCILAAMLKLEKSVNGIVEDQIVDGVVDKAPSQNVVHDALAAITANFSKFKIKLEDSFDYTAAEDLIGEDQVISISADGKASIMLVNNGLQSLTGINYDNITGNTLAEIPHPGKSYFIFNNTDNPIILKHNVGTASTVYKPFKFYNSEDMTLPPGGMAEFKLNDTTNTLDKVPGGAIVINDLTTGGTSDALSAEMGVFLKSLIDSIFQPDILISSVPPTRSGNTFTYPANQYEALISKTLRTNPAQFVTTIGVASTVDHKRIDLVYFRNDNVLVKIVGVESLTTAQRPTLPANAVGVSFFNIYGNTVSDPTTITDELSVQDSLGVEIFKASSYIRFKGVSFNAGAKQIEIDPLVPLSAFLDPIDGNDFTANLENVNKPFKTINALLNNLPVTTGETYTIYITGGTINITRRITPRNLKFVAYSDTALDFTNVMEDDGVTNANAVTNLSGVVTWTFENENISIVNNYVGVKYFSYANNEGRVIFKGTLNTLNWKSTSTENYRASINMYPSSNLKIINYYDSPQDTYGIVNPYPNTYLDIYIVNYFCEFGRAFSAGFSINLTVDNFRKLGVFDFIMYFSTNILNIKNIISTTNFTITPRVAYLNLSGVFSSFVTIDLVSSFTISGNVQNENQIINSYLAGDQYFKNFTGKVGLLNLYVTGRVFFENVNITTETYLAGRGYNHNIENCVDFKGFNAVTQINTSQNLFKTSGLGTGDPKPILLSIDTLTTNALTYGVLTNYVKRQSTFKEKLNEIVIRSKTDLINKTLSSSIKYVVDANLIFVSGEFIKIPAGGLDISGYGFDPSSISKNILNESIFISEVGGSGNLVSSNITYYPGLGSVFNLTDVNGSHAVELNDVNFQGVSGSSLGIINGYRQFTGTTCGLYGLTDGLTLEGDWSGFKLTNSNVIGFGASGTLFKKGASLVFSNRFYIDLNIQIATGSKICDFAEVNFTNDKSLQVVNCYAKINGVVNDATTSTTFPNITPYSSKAYFVNNIGIKNSNNMPYGISTANMQTYADDSAAAAGGIVAIGDTYIETSTGYFKKRLT